MNRSAGKKLVIFTVLLALLIKLALFAYTSFLCPEGKIELDSRAYLKTAGFLADHGTFGWISDGNILIFETFRTPGYPLFLALFHHLWHVPLAGIIFLQILLTAGAAYLTCRAAAFIHPRLGLLSGLLILLDPPTTILSLMLLTESLFLFLLTAFLYCMGTYLKNPGLRRLILSALLLVMCTYVRPVTFYLGVFVAFFVAASGFRSEWKRAVTHALIFALLVYGLLGIWQWRNYRRTGTLSFSTIVMATLHPEMGTGLVPSYEQFVAEKNPSPGEKIRFVVSGTTDSVLSLMTDPGTLKYFKSQPLTIAGKVVGYPFMIFWMTGFLAGIPAGRNNKFFAFYLFLIGYFVAVTVGGTFLGACARFRIPMMPLIAVFAAQGWLTIRDFLENKRNPAT